MASCKVWVQDGEVSGFGDPTEGPGRYVSGGMRWCGQPEGALVKLGDTEIPVCLDHWFHMFDRTARHYILYKGGAFEKAKTT